MSIREKKKLETSESGSLKNLSPAQRAAIVIAMLGEELAKPIVEKLDDAALAKVASGLDALSLLGKDELTEVVVDFLGHLRNTSGGFVSGKLTTKDMVSNVINFRSSPIGESLSSENEDQADEDIRADGVTRDVWKEVEQYPREQLVEYLNTLTPNLIAIVLNRLPVTTSSEIFNYLEDEKLQNIMDYMVEAKTLDPRVENVVTRMVEMELLNSKQETSEESGAHLSGIGELLSLIPSGKRETLVKFLETNHANKVDGIQGALFTIDSLPETLSRNAVPVIFRDMDVDEIVSLLSTLQGPLAPVSEFLLGNISSRLADQIKDKLSDYPPLPPEEAETSQREFLMKIMALKRAGDIES